MSSRQTLQSRIRVGAIFGSGFHREELQVARGVLALSMLVGLSLPIFPQSFNSTSTGADGALNITAPGVTYFDPSKFSPRTNNIYNFTTITIAFGSALKLSGDRVNGPVYFLATGDVTIGGTIDASGQDGVALSDLANRIPSIPGAGGFSGGVGELSGLPAQPGNGPGGGAIETTEATGAKFTGTRYLIPLIGGSGGGGGAATICSLTNTGGAGGGGLLIASTTSISINVKALISVAGGSGGQLGCGGAASGGGLRLVANAIGVNSDSTLSAAKGSPLASDGIVRLEAYHLTVNNPASVVGTFYTSEPIPLTLPIGPQPSLKVASVAGQVINCNPCQFPTVPVPIDTSSPVPVVIQAQGIPPGTAPNLFLFFDNGQPDQTIKAPALQGTLDSSSSTINVTFPQGGTRGFVKATWQP